MACCGGGVKDDKFSTFSDACYTANLPKMKEQLKKSKLSPEKLVNEKGEDGFSPLHRAVQKGSEEVIKFLLENKADVNSLTKTGETPLHIACFHRKKAAVKSILDAPAGFQSINLKEHQHGMTPLHVAIYRGSPDVSKLLLDAGADPEIRDKNGHTALEMADFWTAQAEAGLVSPTSKHHETKTLLVDVLGKMPPTQLGSSNSYSPTVAAVVS